MDFHWNGFCLPSLLFAPKIHLGIQITQNRIGIAKIKIETHTHTKAFLSIRMPKLTSSSKHQIWNLDRGRYFPLFRERLRTERSLRDLKWPNS